jgi:hypothetical protein
VIDLQILANDARETVARPDPVFRLIARKQGFREAAELQQYVDVAPENGARTSS